MRLLLSYGKRNGIWVCLLLIEAAVFSILLSSAEVSVGMMVYAALLFLFVAAVFIVCDFIRYARRHSRLKRLEGHSTLSALELPEAMDQLEADYINLCQILIADQVRQVTESERERQELKEYYTMWVHQIKTPISAMNLLLQTEDFPMKAELSAELFQIEQYVEVVLQYLRLHADTTDFVIQRYDLDDIVRAAVHKYARLFIRSNLKLSYDSVSTRVLTDKKWLGFVIEQLLSNAIKYTKQGEISIYLESEEDREVLVISDNGMGIRSEDIPRVFENGFTGYNGHGDKRSTGIGLYLCKKITGRLSHQISLTSEIGKGTKARITFFR